MKQIMDSADPAFEFAVIATDIVIFTVTEEALNVLLIRMKKEPWEGCWAAPGGLVKPGESVDASAVRNLFETTGVKDVYLEQLYTFGKIDRDPAGRVVSVAYYALIPETGFQLKTTARYAGIQWFPAARLPKLAYDHQAVIAVAVERLRSKLEYTNVVYSLLPETFTLTQMQKIYEIILDKKLDKRNFRKKILSLDFLEKTDKRTTGAPSRPATLYRFKKRKFKMLKIL